MNTCPECCSNDLLFVPGHRTRSDEPGHDDYWECLGCGAIIEDDDQAATVADIKRKQILEGEV